MSVSLPRTELGLLGGVHGSLPMHGVHLDLALISEIVPVNSAATVVLSASVV